MILLEIVPGVSIGPVRLGMTSDEIDQALVSLDYVNPPTLEDLGIVAWCLGNDGNWKSVSGNDKCERVGIRVSANTHDVILLGTKVNDITNEHALRLFESFGGEVAHEYGGFQIDRLGIEAVRWEDSDTRIDSFFVMEPKIT